jgi:hypothetical protein
MITGSVILAYLDPGSGSALVSAIIAAVAALGVTLKLYWHRLLRILGLKRGTGPRDSPAPEPEER